MRSTKLVYVDKKELRRMFCVGALTTSPSFEGGSLAVLSLNEEAE